MAGDLSAPARPSNSLPDERLRVDTILSTGVQSTTVTEMLSMASSPTSPDPLLVSIKAVDPALYPFYGSVDLAPALTLPAALTPTTR